MEENNPRMPDRFYRVCDMPSFQYTVRENHNRLLCFFNRNIFSSGRSLRDIQIKSLSFPGPVSEDSPHYHRHMSFHDTHLAIHARQRNLPLKVQTELLQSKRLYGFI